MTENMHQIKKYANGRLYDVTDKKYITMEELESFVRSGTAFAVVVSKTHEDITESVIARIKKEMKSGIEKKKEIKVKPKIKTKIREKQKAEPKPEFESGTDETLGIFGLLLQKGGETFTGCARGYAELWHSTITLAEEQIDKGVRQLIKAKELSESEAARLKEEIFSFVGNFKNWVGANVEERIHQVISTMNLATRSQLEELAEKIDGLNMKISMLERIESEREDSPEGIDVEKEIRS